MWNLVPYQLCWVLEGLQQRAEEFGDVVEWVHVHILRVHMQMCVCVFEKGMFINSIDKKNAAEDGGCSLSSQPSHL